MKKNKDLQLIWESYSNKFRGPGSPGVNLAKGYVLQALELIDDGDVHLCADAEALEATIGALKKAIEALSKNKDEVPGDDGGSYQKRAFAAGQKFKGKMFADPGE